MSVFLQELQESCNKHLGSCKTLASKVASCLEDLQESCKQMQDSFPWDIPDFIATSEAEQQISPSATTCVLSHLFSRRMLTLAV